LRRGVDCEPLATLDRIHRTLGEYNFAGQYQQLPAPLGGGLVKAEWFKRYRENHRPERFERIVQSWSTANATGRGGKPSYPKFGSFHGGFAARTALLAVEADLPGHAGTGGGCKTKLWDMINLARMSRLGI
jgi:hypothetical protein